MTEDDAPDEQSEQPFDPYRFGKPEHPIPPEYAPPGYVPEPPAEPYPPHPYYGQSPYASIPPPYGAPGGQYPTGPYQYPPVQYPPAPYGYYPPPQPRHGTGMAVASMVLGIISIVASVLFFFDAVFIVLALVFGLISLNGHRPGRGMAIAGVACAAVGLVLAILTTVALNSAVQQCGGWSHLGDPGFSNCVDES